MSYTWEKLYSAVSSMVTSEKTLRERLIDAYSYNINQLNESDFPDDLKETYRLLDKSITAVEAISNEGTIADSVNAMSESEVIEAINTILSLYDSVTKSCDNTNL